MYRELGAKGLKSMLAVPVSFVSEHIETLEEIDMGEWEEGAGQPTLFVSKVDHVRFLER